MTEIIQFPLPHLVSGRDRAPLRRRVYRVRLRPNSEGTYYFRSHSFSRHDGRVYRLSVNPRTGAMKCSCPDFVYRHAVEGGLCKHLQRAVVTAAKAERERQPRLKLAA